MESGKYMSEMAETVHTQKFVTGGYQENCYLLWKEGSAEAIVFDPGDEADVIAAALKKRGLKIAAFLLTHCHFDHIGALEELKALFPAAPIYAPQEEESWLQRPTLNLGYFCGINLKAPPADKLVSEGDKIAVAGLTLEAIHVPGHSPGGTAYFLASSPPRLFCGDILMKGGIGRTDLPGGSSEEALVAGIQTKLFVLPPETLVYSGHGGDTTIGVEKETNPFCADE